MSSEPPAQSQSYFLSYSRSDERFALRLAKDLRGRGISMWVDQLDIHPSEHWDRAIERAVQNCRGIVVILSPKSAASDNVADEISYALDSGKSVIPVMIERCTLPLRITRMHVIDATTNYEQALQNCLEELMRRSGDSTPAPAHEVLHHSTLDAQEVASAKRQFAAIVGPIAGVLVERTAAHASSISELYTLLATHIEAEGERERFLLHVSPTPGAKRTGTPVPKSSKAEIVESPISNGELEKLERLLTRYIGPIGAKVVRRESRSCASLAELRSTLAALISDGTERAEFVRASEHL